MKTKIILFQVFFFIFLFCIKFFFHSRCDVELERVFYIQSGIEVKLEILLLLGLSFGMCSNILKSEKMFHTSLWIGLSLCFLFETSKYIEYRLGFLPNYGDVPIMVSIFLSIVTIFIYVCVLYVVCLLLKKITSNK